MIHNCVWLCIAKHDDVRICANKRLYMIIHERCYAQTCPDSIHVKIDTSIKQYVQIFSNIFRNLRQCAKTTFVQRKKTTICGHVQKVCLKHLRLFRTTYEFRQQSFFDIPGSHKMLYEWRVNFCSRLPWGTLASPFLGFTNCNWRPTSAQKYSRSPKYRSTLHRTDGINVHSH